MTEMNAFLSGFAMATFAMSCVVFFKLWRASHDGFYGYFSVAFGFLAAERLVLISLLILIPQLVVGTPTPEIDNMCWVYLMRLCAFIAITIALVGKNAKATH